MRPLTDLDLKTMVGHSLLGVAIVDGLSACFILDDGTSLYFSVGEDGRLIVETSGEHLH